MRDPKRIYEFCNELATIWATNVPDWRFGQMMMNVLGKMQSGGRDPFFPEEDEMIKFFREFFDMKCTFYGIDTPDFDVASDDELRALFGIGGG